MATGQLWSFGGSGAASDCVGVQQEEAPRGQVQYLSPRSVEFFRRDASAVVGESVAVMY